LRRGGTVTRVLLVRHGQSTWNADGRWQGRADPPLSDLGRRQAEVAVDAVRTLGFARVVASPLARAHETATIIGTALGLTVETDPRLQERDAGEWTGRTRTEIEAGWPGYLEDGTRPPGFETDDILHDRALAAVREVGAVAHEPVLVVSHGGLIRVVERALGSEPHAVPNLGGLDIRRVDGAGGDDHTLTLAGRLVLVDAKAVTVTTPPEV
jgi:probable phosphoglycerate mutase